MGCHREASYHLCMKYVGSSQGSTLIIVIIAMVVLANIALMSAKMIVDHREQISQINFYLSAMIVRNNIQNYLNDNKAWENTYNDSACNTTLACIRTNSNCFAMAAQDNDIACLRSANNTVLFDGSDKDKGFGLDGKECSSAGSPQCPFRLKMKWRVDDPNCLAASCTSPKIEIEASLELTENFAIPFNPGNYSVTVRK